MPSGDRSKAVLLLWIFCLVGFDVCLCYDVLSVPCSLMVTCWEMTDLISWLSSVLCLLVVFHFPICVLKNSKVSKGVKIRNRYNQVQGGTSFVDHL